MTDDATLSDFDAPAGDDDNTTAEPSRADDNRGETDGDRSKSIAHGSATAGDSSAETAAETTRTDDTGDSAGGPREKRSETGFSTYAWGTYTCSRCGDETNRVWRSDADLVCPECKEW